MEILLRYQPTSKKGGSTKTAGSKKGDGNVQSKPSKAIEPEDVEVGENEKILNLYSVF